MKKLKHLLLVALFFATATVLGQTKITGTVLDETGGALPGASIVEKGTKNGTATDFDGKFILNAKSNSGVVVVSFVGYTNKEVAFTSVGGDLGTIQLTEDGAILDEIVITATSFAIGRKTPVAVSTVKAADIEAKLGTQEFPEILKATPGVYATKSGGGYGDGEINLRGFRTQNIAVMINGIPVNDMENGAVYWSNWAGLSDVTSAMQVQRGLGASKVAVPSIGGTINIISKSTDAEKGGAIMMSTGNDGYQKYGMTLSTGLMDNGFAITASASKISGDGYVNGLQFSGVNYFLNISNKINEKHKLSFNAIGTIQDHGQRYNRRTIAEYKATEQGGKRFNPDWGYRDGQIENTSFNFYHKPQISINHDWVISDKSFLTTSVYASFGSGGGRRTQGTKFSNDNYRLGDVDQPINFDLIVEENKANGSNGATDIFAASKNSHEWYGILSTLKTELTETISLSAGLDARAYVGSHWYEVTDLLGGQYFYNDDLTEKTGGQALQVGDHFNKDYDGKVKRYGVFTQLEYSKNDLSVFFSSSLSNSVYSKVDFMSYGAENRESEKADFLGYSSKAGANYNIDNKQNVFTNIGYFSRAPIFDNVFDSDYSVDLYEDALNEKVFSVEVGYGFKTQLFSANVNLYNTSWIDRFMTFNLPGANNTVIKSNVTGLNALHQGIEIDFLLRPIDKLSVTGMASLGNWKWKDDASANSFDENTGEQIGSGTVYAKGLKVSDAAQTTFALGLKYDLLEKTNISLDYNYAGDNYATMNVTSRTDENDRSNTWKLPNYHLFDLGLRHGFEIAGLDTTLSANMNNIFDVEYISDANNGPDSSYGTAQVYYGAGRTFSLGLKIKF
ncbi:outer membrane receptor protein involved in Fe transport [Tenacibaculum adriaticum]|uniref:Outer membrane receptor protein involved in Fe transport n=1 Tax=Tenacibaculum adriaticum TaxID=413713 RepID=A0A5S5DV10_9FLAO|nr:carboxypeptidase-like regulatory domain-containing protein [Tenacibaculum adriaticum]TYP99691.1 outer membrane receptor protein involved in Fe transport [Tenacibaculum adriaticum]